MHKHQYSKIVQRFHTEQLIPFLQTRGSITKAGIASVIIEAIRALVNGQRDNLYSILPLSSSDRNI